MLYAYYGDDFTGSTDVLETLAEAGVPAVLFLGEPTAEDIAAFPGVAAIGIAGDSRSRSPQWMDHNLPRIFGVLKGFGAQVTHYKTCSTFDSAPHVGNIGRAMEIGSRIFEAPFVPILVGAPHLGRFVAFGELFALAEDVVYRIDRHPTMSRHPVTPMHEADLRRHLAQQTSMKVGLVDLRHLTRATLTHELSQGAVAVLFDGVDEVTSAAAGKLVWAEAAQQKLFGVGSSGLTRSLVAAWKTEGLASGERLTATAKAERPVLIVSGSCSPVTSSQITWALENGFEGIPIHPKRLLHEPEIRKQIVDQIIESLQRKRSPVVYSAMGPLPPDEAAYGDQLGAALGHIVRQVVERSALRRVVFCGGDTSSHALQQLPIRALSWAGPLVAGAPLCSAYAPGTIFDGMELVLKGGQVGPRDLFRSALA